MDKSLKKKLKIILWALVIISIPAGFFIYSAFLLDKAYEAYEVTSYSDKIEDIELALKRIDDAEPFAFYDKNLANIKFKLLYSNKEYRKALNALRNKEAIIQKALLYEQLGRSDSALIYYEKAIPKLKRQLKKNKKDVYRTYEIERQIALYYTFLNQTESASDYLSELPADFNPEYKEMILHYDYYIENYVSGGYKDYWEGETIMFGIDSILNMNIDSLITANRFYYNSYSSSGNKYEYEIKKIFEGKAIEIGMNRLD